MNLNLAMVNLYKQRTGSNTLKPKRSPNKPGMDNKAKMSKLEETIAAIDMKSKTTFEQLCGVEEARNELCLIVNRFKDAFEGKAGKSKWPVLIRGSEGLGKTALVEATANYANLNLIPIQLGRFVGLTRNKFEESLEHLIRHGIANQPAIVLIDNLERLSDKEDFRDLIGEAVKRLLEEPLKLLVFCTSSSPLDILTGIRFQFTILLKRPTFEARLGILRNLREESKNLIELTDDDLRAIAMNTPSFSPLDLCLMLDMAVTLHLDRKPTLEICEKAIDKVKKSFEQGTRLIGERPTVTWEQIGGMEEVRQEFADILKQARRVGGSCKFAGIALYGPPGCGKTMVAQAMANEAGFNFISIKPAELVDKFLGETEKNIRQVFQEASEHEPCMIYFDEFDGLCGTRGNKETVTSAIQTLLSEMDGFIGRGQSIIMASTNRLEDIDPAMKRAGRLTEHIYIGPPDLSARREILNVITNKPGLSLAANVDLDMWAKETDSFSGAELDFLVAKAIAKARGDDDEQVVLKQEHFVYAMHRIRRANRELDKKTRSRKRSKID